jgi:hypothetical protein
VELELVGDDGAIARTAVEQRRRPGKQRRATSGRVAASGQAGGRGRSGKLADSGDRASVQVAASKPAGDGEGSRQATATKREGHRQLGIYRRQTGIDRRRHELVNGDANRTTATGIVRWRMGKHRQ